jgi:hypothetical protein
MLCVASCCGSSIGISTWISTFLPRVDITFKDPLFDGGLFPFAGHSIWNVSNKVFISTTMPPHHKPITPRLNPHFRSYSKGCGSQARYNRQPPALLKLQSTNIRRLLLASPHSASPMHRFPSAAGSELRS